MANYRGAVRFADGSVLYFCYQGTTDTAKRLLFAAPEEVVFDQDFIPAARAAADEEVVEVIPYFDHGSREPAFMSRASKSLMLITGPVSLDEVHTSRSDGFY